MNKQNEPFIAVGSIWLLHSLY